MKATKLLVLLAVVSCGSRMEKPVAPVDSKDYEYKQCFYESESSKQSGSVKIGFKVLSDGKIDDEKILESDYKDPNFHACLLEMTREIKFPIPENGVETTGIKVINFSIRKKMNY